MKRLDSAYEVFQFFQDPELWDRISEDDEESKNWQPPLAEQNHWVGFYLKSALIAVMFVHPESASCGQVHISVLHAYRHRCSGDVAFAGMEYLLHDTTYWKFQAVIAAKFPKIMEYVSDIGFEFEGIKVQSFLKNSEYIDQHVFGITQLGIERYLLRKLRGK